MKSELVRYTTDSDTSSPEFDKCIQALESRKIMSRHLSRLSKFAFAQNYIHEGKRLCYGIKLICKDLAVPNDGFDFDHIKKFVRQVYENEFKTRTDAWTAVKDLVTNHRAHEERLRVWKGVAEPVPYDTTRPAPRIRKWQKDLRELWLEQESIRVRGNQENVGNSDNRNFPRDGDKLQASRSSTVHDSSSRKPESQDNSSIYNQGNRPRKATSRQPVPTTPPTKSGRQNNPSLNEPGRRAQARARETTSKLSDTDHKARRRSPKSSSKESRKPSDQERRGSTPGPVLSREKPRHKGNGLRTNGPTEQQSDTEEDRAPKSRLDPSKPKGDSTRRQKRPWGLNKRRPSS
jgi:hypothetical protein